VAAVPTIHWRRVRASYAGRVSGERKGKQLEVNRLGTLSVERLWRIVVDAATLDM